MIKFREGHEIGETALEFVLESVGSERAKIRKADSVLPAWFHTGPLCAASVCKKFIELMSAVLIDVQLDDPNLHSELLWSLGELVKVCIISVDRKSGWQLVCLLCQKLSCERRIADRIKIENDARFEAFILTMPDQRLLWLWQRSIGRSSKSSAS